VLCANVPGVDPTITAAWIAAGVGAVGIAGTVITAWIGSRNTRMATERTIAAGAATTTATLAAAREQQLWDKRCAVYEETLTTLLDRRRQRFGILLRSPGGKAESPEAVYDRDSPGWSQARSRLYAYASDEVLHALDAAEEEHMRAQLAYEDVDRLNQRPPGHPRPASEAERMDAGKTFNAASRGVAKAEQALISVIRDELRSKPDAVRLPGVA
jgi:hypothetical protein